MALKMKIDIRRTRTNCFLNANCQISFTRDAHIKLESSKILLQLTILLTRMQYVSVKWLQLLLYNL